MGGAWRGRRRRAALLLVAGRAWAASRERCDYTTPAGVDCTTCPRGRFRPIEYGAELGTARRECKECPRGRYELEAGAVGECSGKCPLGKYSDTLGARTEDDCKYCPPGTYGSTEALGNRACTAECPVGRYSLEPGLYAATQCKPCPPGLRTGQCEDPHITRKGFFDSTSGEIDERAHAYIIDNEAVARPGDRSPFDFGPKDTPSGTFWVGAGGFVGGKQAEGRPNPDREQRFDPIHKTWNPALENTAGRTNRVFDNEAGADSDTRGNYEGW